MNMIAPNLNAIHAIHMEECAINMDGDIHAYRPNLVIVASCPVWIMESKKGNSHLTVYKNLYAPEIDVQNFNGALYITDRKASVPVTENQKNSPLIVLSVPFGIRTLLTEIGPDVSLTVEPSVNIAHITANGNASVSLAYAKSAHIVAAPRAHVTGLIEGGDDLTLTGKKTSLSRITLGKKEGGHGFDSVKSIVEDTGIITTFGKVNCYEADAVSKSTSVKPSRPQGCICHIGEIAIKKSRLSNGNFVHCAP